MIDFVFSSRAQGQYAATQLIFPSLGLKAVCTAAFLLLLRTTLLIFSCAQLSGHCSASTQHSC
jgi:hypothetical protein